MVLIKMNTSKSAAFPGNQVFLGIANEAWLLTNIALHLQLSSGSLFWSFFGGGVLEAISLTSLSLYDCQYLVTTNSILYNVKYSNVSNIYTKI